LHTVKTPATDIVLDTDASMSLDEEHTVAMAAGIAIGFTLTA